MTLEIKNVGNKTIKKYKLTSNKLTLTIDLHLLSHLEKMSTEAGMRTLESLVLEYFKIKRENKKEEFPLAIRVRDVQKLLNLDIETAIVVVDYINTHPEIIINMLCSELLKILQEKKEIKLRTLSEMLRVHPYWIVITAKKLSTKGFLILTENTIKLSKTFLT